MEQAFLTSISLFNERQMIGIGYLQHVILVHPQVCPNVGCHISQSSSFLILFLHVDLQKQC